MKKLYLHLKENDNSKFINTIKFNPFLKIKTLNDNNGQVKNISAPSKVQVRQYLNFLKKGIQSREFNSMQLLNIKNILLENRFKFSTNNLQEFVDEILLSIDENLKEQ